MSLDSWLAASTPVCFPRLRGDEPAVGCELDERYMFSPPTRG